MLANYSTTDGGSGVKAIIGSAANGAPIDTASLGAKVFTVSASVQVGNRATLSFSYVVRYQIRAQFDQDKVHNSGSTIPIKVELR